MVKVLHCFTQMASNGVTKAGAIGLPIAPKSRQQKTKYEHWVSLNHTRPTVKHRSYQGVAWGQGDDKFFAARSFHHTPHRNQRGEGTAD